MKITGLTVHFFEPRHHEGMEIAKFRWNPAIGNEVAVIHTDSGIEGVVAGTSGWGRQLLGLWRIARDFLEGQDPLDRVKILQMVSSRYHWPMKVRGLLDHGLWDIAGKFYNTPIYRLLGGAREKVLAYGDTVHWDADEKFLESVIEAKAKGYKAIKIHPYCVADDDIRLARKIRKAVGDEMYLMIDTLTYPAPYNREEAMRVGRVLDELNFWWFEDPLHKTDLEGLAWLRQELKVQIRAADTVEDIREYSYMIKLGCMDMIAGPLNMGITELVKLAHLAEVNHLGFEPHDYSGGTASLHVLLGVTQSGFYEKTLPEGYHHEKPYPGVYLDPVQVDSEGYVHAPKKPGLGFEIDFKEAKKVTIEKIDA
jgi:L-alanine-DL-glutamate epimerase-like enolase superfamily enzyme